jgi:hypothetical protein
VVVAVSALRVMELNAILGTFIYPCGYYRMKELDMRGDGEQSNDAFGATVIIGVFLAAFALGSVALARQIEAAGPRIGDIIVFSPQRQVPETARDEAVAELADGQTRAQPARTCLLQARTMMASGGSLIVEAIEPPPTARYRVHWAGGTTSLAPSACGREASVYLGRNDLAALAAAAGVGIDGRARSATAFAGAGSGIVD